MFLYKKVSAQNKSQNLNSQLFLIYRNLRESVKNEWVVTFETAQLENIIFNRK